MSRTFAAVDLGASSGRVVAGRVEDERIDLEVVHRFPNGVVEADGHLRWDLARLAAEVRTGLDRLPEAESIGIDTWGVDYGRRKGLGAQVGRRHEARQRPTYRHIVVDDKNHCECCPPGGAIRMLPTVRGPC
jgi:hypothetical protein